MRKHIYNATMFLGLTSLIFSCTKEPKTPELKIKYESLNTSTNYLTTFTDVQNQSTVDFSGQATRIAMFKEMDAYIKSGTTVTLDAAKIEQMFRNQGNPFSNSALNDATDKTIISKTAASFSSSIADAERNRFLGYFQSVAVASQQNGNTASVGVAGLLNGILVNEKGFEYAQFIQKGLIGAFLLDQIANVYLGAEKQSADNSALVSGKNYTTLAHHWDEAYGYLTQNEIFPKPDPVNTGKYLESFLGGYVRQVDVQGDIFLAFLKGRAAIVNDDKATRETQISKIREILERSIATVTISYLNKTMSATSDKDRFHALSEGLGFLYSLRYAHNAKVDAALSDNLMTALLSKPNGFWDLSSADIVAVRDQIAQRTNIDKNTVVNH